MERDVLGNNTQDFQENMILDMNKQKLAKKEQDYLNNLAIEISDKLPDILYIYDILEQKNIYINRAITEILGYEIDTITQFTLSELSQIIHPDDLPQVTEHYRQVQTISDKEVLKIQYRLQDVNGQWRWVNSRERVFSRTIEGLPKQIMGTIQDLTKYKTIKAILQQQKAAEKLVSAIAQRIHQSLNLDEILKTTVEEVRQFLQTDRTIIYRFKHNWSGIVVVESVESQWQSLLGMILVDEEFAQNYIVLYQQGRIQAVADIYHEGLSQCHIDWLAKLQVRANLVIPILQRDELWGLLVAQNCCSPRQWEDWEIELLQQLATHVGIALEQAQLYQELAIANQELQQLAYVDGLTNLANRRVFDDSLEKEWHRLAREKLPLSLILCDVDYFKYYNDTYGHQGGDNCLQQIAKIIAQTIKRPGDIGSRYGGEEFAIILPNTDIMGAVHVAGEIRSRIGRLKLEHSASEVSKYVTLSFGIASCVPMPNNAPDSLIKSADEALYQAKNEGRNRIVLASSSSIIQDLP